MSASGEARDVRALLIVDLQNDFCEGGSLAVPGGTAVARAVTGYLAGLDGSRYAYVAATQDFHVDPGAHFADTPDFVDSWPAHCVAGTAGAQLHPELDVSRIEQIFRKGQFAAAYSGFEGASESGHTLLGWLTERHVTEVDIAGLTADHCVRATALDAVATGLATTVLLDLTAGVLASTTTAAIAAMRAVGITVTGQPLGKES